MDSSRQTYKSSSCNLCWDYWPSCPGRTACVYAILFGSYFQRHRYLSLLVLLAAVGGFLALFFACLTVIHRSIISCHSCHFHRNDSGNYAVLVVTGWIGFF